MSVYTQTYIYMHVQATAHKQTYQHSIAHKLRRTYTHKKKKISKKNDHINQSFFENLRSV